MSKKNVSLSSELHLVLRAVDGAKLLVQQLAELHFNAEEHGRVAHALSATLVILRERLRLLDRVVRDSVDPRLISIEENEAFDALPGDDGDVVLRAWSTRKSAAKLRRETEQAERRLEVLEEQRRSKRASEDE